MDHRYLVFLGAAVLGGLLGLVFRVRTIVIGLAIIIGLTVVRIGIASGNGREDLALYLGIASMALPFLGLIMVIVVGVVRAAGRTDDDEA